MHILAWTPPLPLRPVAEVRRPQQEAGRLELAAPPPGFAVAEDRDGSITYRGSSLLYRRLANSGVNVLGLRHGQAVSNAQSETLGQPLLYGQSESPLTDKGRTQARECTAAMLEQLGGDDWLQQAVQDPCKLPVLYSSDLSRTRETAEILKAGLAAEAERLGGPAAREVVEQHLAIVVDSRLRETHFGRFEARPFAELQRAYPEFVSNWRPPQGMGTDFRHRFPGGESRADVMRRVASLLENCCLRHPQRTVILVSHGETLLSTRALLGKAPLVNGKVAAESGVIPNAAPFWLVNENRQQDLPAGCSPRPHDLQ